MEILLLVIVALLLVFLIIIQLRRNDTKPNTELLEYLKTTNVRLNEQNRSFNQRLDMATNVIVQVQKNIGEFSEIGRSVKQLQEFLNSPKLRGNIGEQVLKELLKQFLPHGSYKLQYNFKNGERVDAVVVTSGGLIPIDSKFPMENFKKSSLDKTFVKEFQRDVRKHIDDISKKYILTDEGTVDYALMYIPSESVYYEIANDNLLFDYAATKRILPVSPITFYAYLKAILVSFEGQKIEKQAKEILTTIRSIKKDFEKTQDNLNTLQKHMTNAYNMMNQVFGSFAKLGQKIEGVQALESGDKNS